MSRHIKIEKSKDVECKRRHLFIKPVGLLPIDLPLEVQLLKLIQTGIRGATKKTSRHFFFTLLKAWYLKSHNFSIDNKRLFLNNYCSILRRPFDNGKGATSFFTVQPLLKHFQSLFCRNQNAALSFELKQSLLLKSEKYKLKYQIEKERSERGIKILNFKTKLAKILGAKFRRIFFFTWTKSLNAGGVAKFDRFESALKYDEARRILLYLYRFRSTESTKEKLFKWAFFKKLFKKWLKRFRHIQKNRLFLSIFKAMFTRLTATHEKKLQSIWHFVRKFKRRVGGKSGLTFFSRYIFMQPELLLVLLGLAPNKKAGRLYAQSGVCAINGLVGNALSKSLVPGDICQISPTIWKQVKIFQNYHKWNFIKTRLNKFSFIAVDWAICAFFVVKWPKGYEMAAPKFLTERWLRYYVRNLSVRKRKPQKFKMFWKGYVVSFLG